MAKDMGAKLVIPWHFERFQFNSASPDEFIRECRQQGQPFKVLHCGEQWHSWSRLLTHRFDRSASERTEVQLLLDSSDCPQARSSPLPVATGVILWCPKPGTTL